MILYYTLMTGEVISPTKDNPDRVVPGLFAAGEAACASVHGANRLGTLRKEKRRVLS